MNKIKKIGKLLKNDIVLRFLLENSSVLTLCKLKSFLPKTKSYKSISEDPGRGSEEEIKKNKYIPILFKNILISIAGNLIIEEGSIFLHWIISNTIFSKVKYFREQNWITNPFSLKALINWSKGNAYLTILGGIILGVLETHLPKINRKELDDNNFSLGKFIWKFSITRAMVDIIFYFGHRLLHVNNSIYKLIHRRHHEHYTTNLTTNFKFTTTDAFIESALPIFIGIGTLKYLNFPLTRYEINLIVAYIAWFETGSHSGKHIPIISMIPPLSIFYNSIYDIDKYNCIFHEIHHNKRFCNYGTTQWLDALFSTIIKSIDY